MKRLLTTVAAAGLALVTACTAGTESSAPKIGASPAGHEPVTIQFWHGFSADSELKAFEDTLAGFNRKYPWITVKATKAIQDDQILQSVRGGNPRGAPHQEAAWELVKYLTTDTDALVTLPALQSPALKKDPHFQTFLDIFANPNSTTLPAHINSVFNQQTLQEAQIKWESGRAPDLGALLADVDKKINDKLEPTAGN